MGLTKLGWLCVLGIILVVGTLAATRGLYGVRHVGSSESPASDPADPSGFLRGNAIQGGDSSESNPRVSEIRDRLRDQPDVAAAFVSLQTPIRNEAGSPGPAFMNIYVQWHSPTPPPEVRLESIAGWAATRMEPDKGVAVCVRDSAGRLYRTR